MILAVDGKILDMDNRTAGEKIKQNRNPFRFIFPSYLHFAHHKIEIQKATSVCTVDAFGSLKSLCDNNQKKKKKIE